MSDIFTISEDKAVHGSGGSSRGPRLVAHGLAEIDDDSPLTRPGASCDGCQRSAEALNRRLRSAMVRVRRREGAARMAEADRIDAKRHREPSDAMTVASAQAVRLHATVSGHRTPAPTAVRNTRLAA
jgi:hypothetical protein